VAITVSVRLCFTPFLITIKLKTIYLHIYIDTTLCFALVFRPNNTHPQNEGKAIPVTGRGGPYGCETSRLPHFLDSRLTDGGEVVSCTRRPPFTPPEDSWYSFLLEAASTPGPIVRLEELVRSIGKFNDLFASRTRDLPAAGVRDVTSEKVIQYSSYSSLWDLQIQCKVASSSSDEVDIFYWPNPSSLTMALGSTQPLIETSTRNVPGG
jgi:hypothetical protein